MSVQKKGLGKGLSALLGDIENQIDNDKNQNPICNFFQP